MIDRSLSDPDLEGTVRVVSASATHVGHVRATNEDSLLTATPIHLVADGMGGHNAGEVASAIAVEEFEKLTLQQNVTVEQLGDALHTASVRIGELGGESTLGAGTTVALVATMVLDGIGYWVVMNLGDSRVYRLSGEIFEQVSVDHSVVQELMDRGDLTAEQAKVHPYRHMVTRALGAGPESDPDYWLIPAETGDRMLICSDGLTGEVDDEAIERLLRSPADVRTVCEDLVTRALDGGGHDNVSVVVVEAVEVVGQPLAAESTAGGAITRSTRTPSRAVSRRMAALDERGEGRRRGEERGGDGAARHRHVDPAGARHPGPAGERLGGARARAAQAGDRGGLDRAGGQARPGGLPRPARRGRAARQRRQAHRHPLRLP